MKLWAVLTEPVTLRLARRAALTGISLVFATVLIFALIQLAPGHVERLVAEQQAGGAATTKTVEAVRRELGLDKPYPERYLLWLGNSLHGDLGISFRTGHPIAPDLVDRSRHTLILLLLGTIFAGAVGVGSALFAAARPYGLVDRTIRAFSIGAVSVPMFYLGAVLILVFGLKLGILPILGDTGPVSWILPTIALGLAPAAVVSMFARVLLEREISNPYVVTARSRGATRSRIVFRETLPNIAPQTISTLLTQVGFSMLPGTIVAETVFAWNGLGNYFLQAVLFRDFPVMQAVLLIFVAVVIGLNLLADALQTLADPRQRLASNRAAG
ncbi:MAG: ABC transporter permease [Candidatus Dormibacter sp.]|uniref:ABC transporter permease n=1 Tax=Candidatus Dormibacter sp. TaxID=2973982 RepID=UPI000DB78C5C|nr:MAG: ABC transporter permease [Candidatus Dormibacteraeota bacterium]